VERAPSNALVANGATREQVGLSGAREVDAFVGDVEVMGKISHVPNDNVNERWQGLLLYKVRGR
jgi:hypothetical protein